MEKLPYFIVNDEKEAYIRFQEGIVRKSAIFTACSLLLDKAYFRIFKENGDIVIKLTRKSIPLTQIALNITDEVIKFTFYQVQYKRSSDKKSLIMQRLAMLQ